MAWAALIRLFLLGSGNNTADGQFSWSKQAKGDKQWKPSDWRSRGWIEWTRPIAMTSRLTAAEAKRLVRRHPEADVSRDDVEEALRDEIAAARGSIM